MTRNKIAWLSAALTLLGAATASAQWDPESGDTGQGWQPPPAEQTPPPQETPPPQQTPPPQGGGWGQPPAEQPPAGGGWGSESERPPGMGGVAAPADQTPAGETDHDQVGAGISFFGVNRINVAPANAGGALSLTLPTVGARIWFGGVGLDIGLGLGTTTQKTYNSCPGGTTTGGCVDPATGDSETQVSGIDGGFGIGLHVGVPIAAAVSRHAAFLIIPEVGFAYGQATLYNPLSADQDVDLSGIQLDVGVRVGGEVHFGAIGLPNLSLQLTIGLGLRYSSRSAKNSVPFMDPSLVDFSETELSIRTIANDLMNGTIRVNYYF
ncbi:MAG: hypothetical protein H6721_10815 [Sandaracinus sp.]|nr:hypothetical protein [Sandaracinus sp.]